MKNPAAVALAKLGKGVRRNYSAEEIRKRTERLIQARAIKAAKKTIVSEKIYSWKDEVGTTSIPTYLVTARPSGN